ncbi:MAG: carbamoyltransferase HypF [Candidatus Thorarchaeota archaeon]|nr:carbamoyltransferase HypF [Candidatus Thorarchaeota archaeon]
MWGILRLLDRASIHVNGIVQGVGFRPFVYREAKHLSLVGYVLNLGDAGVSIVVEGDKKLIKELIRRIQENLPSISRIDSLNVKWSEAEKKFQEFEIVKSSMSRGEESSPVIPPDIAICIDCIDNLLNRESRWYHYPFTSCAACGPRFSTITDLPYDRPNTTMAEFPLCNSCNTGYTNPLDRRYHAQTTACDTCGPCYTLYDKNGKKVTSKNLIYDISNLLEQGAIVATQGIAGTHLMTITSDSKPIKELRRRKKRSQRPFAIMVKDSQILKQHFDVTKVEQSLLDSWRRPIVLVKKRNASNVIPSESIDLISPGLDTVGVMLPYSPLHHLLFQNLDESYLVMTSANPSGVPMYITPESVLSSLKGVVDYFLLHDRRVYQRADDSVIKVVGHENPVFIRRARGYVPEPLAVDKLPKSIKLLALGPEEKATVSILKSGKVYPTQHIGDTNNIDSMDFLIDAYQHMMHLVGLQELDGIICDLHPEFLSTVHAEEITRNMEIPLFRVQHHHSHLSSILIDHNMALDTCIVCITADGYGYGLDGSAWGGEVLFGNAKEFENRGGLDAQVYPGGDLTAIYAVRPLVGILNQFLSEDEIFKITKDMPISNSEIISEKSLRTILGAINQNIGSITSSSAGRFLDAATTLLKICYTNSYDGECPMKLEAVASGNHTVDMKTELVNKGNRLVLDTTKFFESLLNFQKSGQSIGNLAYAVQWHLGDSFARIAIDIAEKEQVKYVGFSGGVALNRVITKAAVERIISNGLVPLLHRNVPPGDGGISIGQIGVGTTLLQDS